MDNSLKDSIFINSEKFKSTAEKNNFFSKLQEKTNLKLNPENDYVEYERDWNSLADMAVGAEEN